MRFTGGSCCREPLNNSARSAFQSEKPQIVWCDASDSSHSYGQGSQRARCGFSGETLRDGPLRGLRLVWPRLFGTTKPRSPKPGRSLPQRRRRARAELFRGSLGAGRNGRGLGVWHRVLFRDLLARAEWSLGLRVTTRFRLRSLSERGRLDCACTGLLGDAEAGSSVGR